MRQDKDHDVVLILERKTDDFSTRGRLEVSAGQLFALEELDADLTLGVVPGPEELSGEGDRVELGPPLRLEVQDVDQDQAGVSVDALCEAKHKSQCETFSSSISKRQFIYS